MTTFVFGDPSELINDFFLVFLTGLMTGAVVYAACAYPQLRKRHFRNTESYKGLGLFLWACIAVLSVFGGYWTCSHRFTALEAWSAEVVIQYRWPSRKVHIPCGNLKYIDLLSHPRQATRQVLVYTQDRVQYKSRKLHRDKITPIYEEIQKTACHNQ